MPADYTVRQWMNGVASRLKLSLFSTAIVIWKIKEDLRGFGLAKCCPIYHRLATEPAICFVTRQTRKSFQRSSNVRDTTDPSLVLI